VPFSLGTPVDLANRSSFQINNNMVGFPARIGSGNQAKRGFINSSYAVVFPETRSHSPAGTSAGTFSV
jgi:hypothetical protein